MLVLSRFVGEKLIIGQGPTEVVITVVRIRDGNKVWLGIDAPPDVSVDREEVRAEKLRHGGNTFPHV